MAALPGDDIVLDVASRQRLPRLSTAQAPGQARQYRRYPRVVTPAANGPLLGITPLLRTPLTLVLNATEDLHLHAKL